MKKRLGLVITTLLSLGLCFSCAQQPPTAITPVVVLPALTDIPQFSLPLTVPQAYRSIPHKRTEFAPLYSDIPEQEKAYLALMFSLIDQAIALRVSTLQEFQGRNYNPNRIDEYQVLIDFTNTIQPPANLSTYHEQIRLALQAQQSFYTDWRTKGSSFSAGHNGIRNHPQVKAASSQLIAAHSTLVQTYPQEDSLNKDAFFDYHCALDFI
ncbi:MAG: hypothetical protein AAFU53_19940 [Cyanobacteria bacterium J06632_3]